MVNEATALPVKIHFLDDDGIVTRELKDIVFDQTFAPDTFLTEPPAGYDVTTKDSNEQ